MRKVHPPLDTPRALIVDMGGVILRTEDPAPRTALAQQFGMTREELEWLVFESPSADAATLGQIPEEEHWATIGRILHLSSAEVAGFRNQFFAGDRENRELVALLRSVRPRVKTGLLSNAWSGARRTALEAYSYLDAIDLAIYSAEVGLVKPDPRIYRLMLDRLGMQPSEAVFVDDSQKNVAAAEALGLRALHYDDNDAVLPALRALFPLPGA